VGPGSALRDRYERLPYVGAVESARMSCCQVFPLQGVYDSNLRDTLGMSEACSLSQHVEYQLTNVYVVYVDNWNLVIDGNLG
jgi:hypothetical protein